MYLVGYLQPYEKEDGTKHVKIVNPVQCLDGDEICLAVEKLCMTIDYGMDNFESEMWDALKDMAYYESNHVVIDLHGSLVLVDLIVGKESDLRAKFEFSDSL